MSHGQGPYSKSIASRTGVKKHTKDSSLAPKGQAHRGKIGDLDAYGGRLTLKKLHPELVGEGDRFMLDRYFQMFQPKCTGYNRTIVPIAIDFMNAGYLFPWTTMTFVLRYTVVTCQNYFPDLTSFAEINRDNFMAIVENYEIMFPEPLVAAISNLKVQGAPRQLLSNFYSQHAKRKPPPGGLREPFKAWPEKVVLSVIMKGTRRQEWETQMADEVRDCAEAAAAEPFTEAQIAENMRQAVVARNREDRLNRAAAMKRKYEDDQIMVYNSDDEDLDGGSRARRAVTF
jgi:hypothetical protein